MKPTLMFDKSTFEALKAAIHDAAQERYEVVANSALVHEIARDLEIGHDDERKREPVARVRSLAERFRGNYSVQADWSVLTERELHGDATVPMTGKPVPQDHEIGYVNGEQLGIRALVDGKPMTAKESWLRRVLAGDIKRPESVRREPFGPEALLGRLGEHLKPLTVANKDLAAQRLVVATVDAFMDDPSNTPALLRWFAEGTPVPGRRSDGRWLKMQRRWKTLGKPPFRKLAPFAYHCARVSLLYVIGYTVWPKPREPNDEKDLDHLRYLPFCSVFATGDKFVRAMASYLVDKEYQRVIGTEELKVELAAEAGAMDSRPEDHGLVGGGG